ncbi:tyrosine-type recombinase/integrase [Actinomadura sp. CNU-125]|uniref:tyrosine-type recombinase/integrase n=1 Tax=Actinomadura sp. CNU-125 TaxID=1904961 RepID=UPI0039671F72
MTVSGSRSLKRASNTRCSPSTCGGPCVHTLTPRSRSRAGRWNSPDRLWKLLRRHHARQAKEKLKAGEEWQDSGRCSARRPGEAAGRRERSTGVPAHQQEGGIGETWSPRELRPSFVSITSESGLPIEAIADLCGHSSPSVTGEIYRHQLRPVITRGAQVGDSVFGSREVSVGRVRVAPLLAPRRP